MKKILILSFLIVSLLITGCAKKPVLEVSLQEIKLKVGEKSKIEASVLNGDSSLIKYTSNSPTIVSVNEKGEIEALSKGMTRINITYEDDDNELSEYCNITVEENDDVKEIIVQDGVIVVNKDDSYHLNFQINPVGGKILKTVYTSSNPSVASIDENGSISGLEYGNTIVKVTINDYVSKEIPVYVIEKDVNPQFVVLPTEISSKYESLELYIGDSKNILVDILGNSLKDCLYNVQSDNLEVLRIDNDKIVGVSDGNATLTITTINNLTKKIGVTVKSKEVPVSQIVLESKSSYSISVGGTIGLNVKVLPLNATNKELSFTSSNQSVATVSNDGIVKAVGEGSSIITISTSDGSKKITVAINVSSQSSNNSSSGNSGGNSSGGSSSGSSKGNSTGNIPPIDSSIPGAGSEEAFQACRNSSPILILYINGVRYGQDGSITIKVGQTVNVKVELPTQCGKFIRMVRNNYDGSSNWSSIVKQVNTPKATASSPVSVSSYTWSITGLKAGGAKLSQTVQFDVRTAKGTTGNIKSMVRLGIQVVN